MSRFCSASAPTKRMLYPIFRKASENDDVPLIFSAENNGAQKRLKTSITEHNNSNDATDDTNIQKEESVNATIASCSDNENESLEEQRDEAHEKEDDISDTEARRRDSIVYQLIHRSTTASRLHNPPAAHKSWSPWAVLDTSGAVATCTAWDEQGVLLAVATSAKTVCVYDSDVVRVPQQQQQQRVIEPMCTFSIPGTVTCMEWDANDNLCMAFRGSGVRVYDVDRLVEQGNAKSCFMSLSHSMIRGSAIAIQQLPRRQWLVSYRDGHVALYKCKSLHAGVSLVWKWRTDNDCFYKIAPLQNQGVLLLGQSSCIQLDWKHCTRAAFSTQKSPTVLKRWNSTTATQEHQYGRIQSLQVISESATSLHCKCVTENGWILTMNLVHDKKQAAVRLIHGPPRVVILETTCGEKESSEHYSKPLLPVTAYSTTSLLVWETVPTVTHVLPHHDRRNVGGSLQVIRSDERSLSIMDIHHRIAKLSLKSCATTITLHPSNEYLIVGNKGGNLQIWAARKLSKKRKHSE
jgi:hypothetical protein